MLCISITGFAADPARITTLLGLLPTRVRRLSDGGRKPFNGWWFEAHEGPLTGGEDHERGLSVLRGVLRGREARFQTVWGELAPTKMSVYGGLYHQHDEQCGIWLAPDDMAMLAACHLGWGLDLFGLGRTPVLPPGADPANDG